MFLNIFLIFIVIYLCVRKFVQRKSDSVACLVGKTALVTGGNSGLGYATCVLLASRGCRVILADRDNGEKSRDNIIKATGNSNIVYKYLDLSSLKGVREFATELKKTEEKIDILINNAGIGTSVQRTTEYGLNTVMQVNYFGAFLLTHLLLDLLKASTSARILFSGSISIFSHNLSLDNLNLTKSDGKTFRRQQYSNTKLCNVLAAQEFGKRLQKYGITANSVDPGAVKTAIFQRAMKIYYSLAFHIPTSLILSVVGVSPLEGAQTIFHVATSDKLKDKTSGHYSYLLPWLKPSILKDQKFCDEIWNKTEELVKLSDEEKLMPF